MIDALISNLRILIIIFLFNFETGLRKAVTLITSPYLSRISHHIVITSPSWNSHCQRIASEILRGIDRHVVYAAFLFWSPFRAKHKIFVGSIGGAQPQCTTRCICDKYRAHGRPKVRLYDHRVVESGNHP